MATSSAKTLTRRRSSLRATDWSRVSLVREVNIGLDEFAPRGDIPSLDFDRVVNSYSIEATKKRLQKKCRLYNDDTNNWDSMSYFAFQGKSQDEDNARKKRLRLLNLPNEKEVMQWILTLLIGLSCGLLAIFIVYCTEHIVKFRVNRVNRAMQWLSGTADEEELHQLFPLDWVANISRWLTLTFGMWDIFFEESLVNVGLVFISATMCLYFAPAAIGSGIPEVKAYLNGSRVPSFANVNILLAKIFGTILSVSSGLVVGPEGPSVHIGAIIGQGLTKTTRLDIALYNFRSKHPRWSGWCGCAKTGKVEAGKAPATPVGQEGEAAVLVNKRGSLTLDDLPLNYGGVKNEDNLASLPDAQWSLSSLWDESTEDHLSEGQSCLSNFVAALSTFRNDTDRRDLISIGAATGFAVAFGAPVGGLLYSIEEASSFYTIRLMWRTLVGTAVGTFVIAVYHGDLSNFSILSLGDSAAESLASVTATSILNQVFCYLLIGVFGGLIGAAFNSFYCFMGRMRSRFYDLRPQRSGMLKLLDVVLVSVATSSATFAPSFLLPASWVCSEIPSAQGGEAQEFLRFNCQVGEFNEVATILQGSRDEALNAIFNDPTQFQSRTLFLCGTVLFALMLITFGTPIPSGLFMPTLLTGAMYGGWAGILIKEYIIEDANPAHIALLAATAMLAGIQRTTVSLCVIMMEATGQVKVLLPLIIAVNVARYVADIFNEGFYHINMHLKHYPYLEHFIKQSFDIPVVSDIMSSPVIAIHELETAGTIETLLKENDVDGFPVLKRSTKEYVGFIRRDQLVALLECGIYVNSQRELSSRKSIIRGAMRRADTQNVSHALIGDHDMYTHASRATVKPNDQYRWLRDNVLLTGDDRVVAGTNEMMPEVEIHLLRTVVDFDANGVPFVNLNEEEREETVDVGAAMNRGAYSVVQNTPVSKAYKLFTSLGLRILPVLGRNGCVVGIITRSNLREGYMEGRTGLQMH